MTQNCKGNALIYVLLAVAMLAALTFAISSDNRGAQQNQITAAQARLMAADLISHAAAAEQVVLQMTQWGKDYDDLRFDLPGTVGYASNTSDQIHHPAGGGLNVMGTGDNFFDGVGTIGWRFQGNINIEWTNSTNTDFLYSFINVNPTICAQLNERMTGSSTIPTTTIDFANTLTEGGSDDDFLSADCAPCEGVKAMCISDGTTNAFYMIIGAR